MDQQSTLQNPAPSAPRTVSIRKLYLTRRAGAIREILNGSKENLGGFIAQVHSSEFNATKDEMLFARTLQWMQNNLHTEGNIADAAREFGVSVRKIQRLFAFFLDKSYTSVLLEMRIQAAKGYLKQMKHSVGEVAFLVGIKDHAYFTYLFRKSTGTTPTEFRLSTLEAQAAK